MIGEFNRQWSEITARLDWLDQAVHLRGFYPAPKTIESNGAGGLMLRWTYGLVMEIGHDGAVRKWR